ncbi:MAG TPA: hypothetical protein VF144_18990 [Chitinophagaceae bacterium]
MEIHAHAHTPRKKWTHYFWEFLMLFLAVFCGFLAENQREHYVENQRAKKFCLALLEDLQTDTSEIQISKREIQNFLKTTDVFFEELKKNRQLQSDSILQTIGAKEIYHYNFFDATMGNYEQIKNSGALRYFDQNIVKKLTIYETGARKLAQEKQFYQEFLNTVIIPFCTRIANADFLNNADNPAVSKQWLFIADPDYELFNQWKNYVYELRKKQTQHDWALNRHLKRALELMEALKQE